VICSDFQERGKRGGGFENAANEKGKKKKKKRGEGQAQPGGGLTW